MDPTSTTIPETVRDQLQPAQDEGPHKQFADLGVGLHQREQLIAADLDRLARLGHARSQAAIGGLRAD